MTEPAQKGLLCKNSCIKHIQVEWVEEIFVKGRRVRLVTCGLVYN